MKTLSYKWEQNLRFITTLPLVTNSNINMFMYIFCHLLSFICNNNLLRKQCSLAKISIAQKHILQELYISYMACKIFNSSNS